MEVSTCEVTAVSRLRVQKDGPKASQSPVDLQFRSQGVSYQGKEFVSIFEASQAPAVVSRQRSALVNWTWASALAE